MASSAPVRPAVGVAPAGATTPWRSRSIFVSSTFDDMHAERDHLQQYVFPELAERLREHRIHLEVIDLRWGVDTSSLRDRKAKEALVLKVCLAEIDRCRPLFIALVGDRYGWTPPAERLVAAASEAGLALDSPSVSITHLEIAYALGAPEGTTPYFYVRHGLQYERIPDVARARYSDAFGSSEDFSKVEQLKARLAEQHPQRVRRYTPAWDATRRSLVGLEAFGATVLKDLWGELSQGLGRVAGEGDWETAERRQLDAFIEDRARRAFGRAELIDGIVARAVEVSAPEQAPKPTLVLGESGSGKSSIFACVARRLQGLELVLLTHSAGISTRSASVDDLLMRWCEDIQQVLGEQDGAEMPRGSELEGLFRSLLSRAAARAPVVMLIDALDQLESTARASYLKWLPSQAEWPANVALIATSAPGLCAGAMLSRDAEVIRVPPLGKEESGAVADRICASYRKVLPRAVRTALLGKKLPDARPAAGNPLWLTLAVNELIVLGRR